MAVVYGSDPASAFAASSQLDQQRVQNYLQSIAANRNAQLQGWQAAQQIAAARQAQEQQQQAQMLQLAHLAAQQQQAQQNFGLSQQQIAETGRHNLADESYKTAALGRVNASLLAEQNRQKNDEAAQNELATAHADLAKRLNLRNMLTALKTRMEPSAQSKALEAATGADFSPTGDPAYSNKWFWHGAPRASRTAEVMQGIAADASGLPTDFSGANSIKDYADVVTKAIEARLKTLPDPEKIKNIDTIFSQDEAGNYQPILRPSPMSVLTGGTATTAAAPTSVAVGPVAQPGIPTRPYFRTEADLQEARLPSGTTVMLWDEKQKKYRRAMWTE